MQKKLGINISDVTSPNKSKWENKVKGKAIDRIKKNDERRYAGKKKTVAQNGMTIGKGNSTSECVKVIP